MSRCAASTGATSTPFRTGTVVDDPIPCRDDHAEATGARVEHVDDGLSAEHRAEASKPSIAGIGERRGIETHGRRAEEPKRRRALLSAAGRAHLDRPWSPVSAVAHCPHDEADTGADRRAGKEDPHGGEHTSWTSRAIVHRAPQLRAYRGRGGSDALLQLVELLDGHQHRPGLRAFGRSHDTLALEEVHEPAGASESDAQFALEHARRSKP